MAKETEQQTMEEYLLSLNRKVVGNAQIHHIIVVYFFFMIFALI